MLTVRIILIEFKSKTYYFLIVEKMVNIKQIKNTWIYCKNILIYN